MQKKYQEGTYIPPNQIFFKTELPYNEKTSIITISDRDEITNDIHRLSDALCENIGNNNSDVNSRLNTIVETLNQINNSITNSKYYH